MLWTNLFFKFFQIKDINTTGLIGQLYFPFLLLMLRSDVECCVMWQKRFVGSHFNIVCKTVPNSNAQTTLPLNFTFSCYVNKRKHFEFQPLIMPKNLLKFRGYFTKLHQRFEKMLSRIGPWFSAKGYRSHNNIIFQLNSLTKYITHNKMGMARNFTTNLLHIFF